MCASATMSPLGMTNDFRSKASDVLVSHTARSFTVFYNEGLGFFKRCVRLSCTAALPTSSIRLLCLIKTFSPFTRLMKLYCGDTRREEAPSAEGAEL